MSAPRLIDVHHHFLTPRYVAARERLGVRTGPGFEGALQWTPEASLAAMDEAGIAAAVLSFTSNWTPFAAAEARELARDANEYAAALRSRHPDRFGFLAAIPMPDIDAALTAISHAFDVLHADGVSTTTSYGDAWLGDPRFDPVLAELDRRGTVVFVHPQAPAATVRITPPVPDGTVEFMFDIVRCVTAMLFRGVFARYPGIRFVFTHGGGGLPVLAERIARNAALQPDVARLLPEGGAAEVLRSLHLDVTTSTNPAAFAALRTFMPAERLLFGSDFPFVSPMATRRGLDAAGLEASLHVAIAETNAVRLFPRLGG